MSQLLARIDALLASELDPARRGELIAQRACYLARIGDFGAARKDVTQLRADFPSGTAPRVTVLVMLAEGLIQTMERMSLEGLDRIRRAQILSVGMRDRQLVALTSAWLAHWQSERSEFKGMARSIELSLGNAEPGDSEAVARASMVVANAFQAVGDRVGAAVWYAAVRHHAVQAGDQATTEAMIYNRAAFSVGFLRATACRQVVDTTHLATVTSEIASARNYQRLIGVNVLTNFDQLWIARMLMLQGKYVEAIDALRTVRELSPFNEKNFDRSFIDLEIAYCLAHLGQVDAALAVIPDTGTSFDGLHLDEQLVAAWLRQQLAKVDERFGDATEASRATAIAAAAYGAEQDELASLLAPFRAMQPPGVPTSLVEAEARRAHKTHETP